MGVAILCYLKLIDRTFFYEYFSYAACSLVSYLLRL